MRDNIQEQTLFVVILIFNVLLCTLLYKLVSYQIDKLFFKRLNINGNEIEILEEENSSYFDKYLNEVLYVFENCGANCIVFEDIDRFDDEMVFERLREINALVNNRINKKEKVLKFLYLIKDEIFTNKDRTKFFDFIIPIIPYSDSSNAFNVILNNIKDTEYDIELDRNFLRGVSLYLDDYRLIKNILNEYSVYEKKLNTISLNYNKLFAMIVYKNIFPKDYSDLILNKGYVFSVFSEKSNYMNKILSDLNSKKAEYTNRINKSNDEILNNKKELDSLKDNLYRYDNNFKNQEYSKRLAFIEDKKIIKELEEKKQETEIKITAIRSSSLCQLLNDNDLNEYFDDIEATNPLGEIDKFDDIKRSDYYGLLKYLIANGYIDESYHDYLSYFYPNSITIRDKVFLRSILERNALAYDYKLDNPKLILENLNNSQLLLKEVRNFDLFEYILDRGDYNNNSVVSIINNVCRDNCYMFIKDYMYYKPYYKFIEMISINYPSYIQQVIDKRYYTERETRQFITVCLLTDKADIVDFLNMEGILAKWISNDSEFLDANKDNETANNAIGIAQSLEYLKVKFVLINRTDTINTILLKEIYERCLYELNKANLQLMLKCFDNEIKISTLFTMVFKDYNQSPLLKYIKDNLEKGLESYLDIFTGIIEDDEETVCSILNSSSINNDLKMHYLKQSNVKIDNIEEIDGELLRKELLKMQKITYSSKNIICCYKDFKLSKELIAFINSDHAELDYKILNETSIINSLAIDCLKSDDIDNDKCKQIIVNCLVPLSQFNIQTIHDDKLDIAIRNHVILMNPSNINFIRNYYKDHLEIFISENIDDYCEKNLLQGKIPGELNIVLSSEHIDENHKIKLLKMIREAISLNGICISDNVKIEIINNHLSMDDVQYLITNYPSENIGVKEAIIKRLCILSRWELYDLGFDILYDVLSYKDLDFTKKLRIFSDNISKLDGEEIKDCLICLNEKKMADKLFVSQSYKVPCSTKNKEIVRVLENYKIIESPTVSEDGSYYKNLKLKNKKYKLKD